MPDNDRPDLGPPILTICLCESGAVTLDLAEGKTMNEDEVRHGFAKMLAAIYKQLYDIPATAGYSPLQCARHVAAVLELAEAYTDGGCSEGGTIGIRTPER